MNAEQLIRHFDRISEAPDAVTRLRRFVLELAVRGRLVEQDSDDEPASGLYQSILAEKACLLKRRGLRGGKPLGQVSDGDAPFRAAVDEFG